MPFTGFPAFLRAAATELGLPDPVVADAQRQAAISQVASLVSQAESQSPPHPDTLRRINELSAGLAVAALAALRMRQVVDASPLPVVVVRNGASEPAPSSPRRGRPLSETPA